MDSMTVEEALKEFLADHKARGSRPKTLEWYGKTCRYLLRPWLGQPVSCLVVFTINKALAHDVKPSTLANYDRALRGFCSWLHGVELLPKNPFHGRKRVKENWQPKQTLTLEEMQALFTVARADKRYRYRHQAILSLFLDVGLRSSEVARLGIQDVDWTTGVLKINGKTGWGSVAVSKRTIKVLRRYVTHERKGNSTGPLFIRAGKPLSALTLSHLINRLGKRAGIQRPVGPHLLRHTFALHYLRRGGDAFSLQRIMRHTTPFTTTRYLSFVTEDLQQKVELCSPLAGLSFVE